MRVLKRLLKIFLGLRRVVEIGVESAYGEERIGPGLRVVYLTVFILLAVAAQRLYKLLNRIFLFADA